MTTTQIINRLHRGLVKTEMVTIPEGWRLEQMAEALEKRGYSTGRSFWQLAVRPVSATISWSTDRLTPR